MNLKDAGARVGLLVKTYPKLSETFILEEIIGLERAGLALEIFSLMRPTDEMVHASVKQVEACVHYATASGLKGGWHVLASHVASAYANPLGYVRALAFVMSNLSSRRDVGFKSFVQAGALAPQLRAASIAHLHVHFASEPACVAEVIERMCGIPFSLSAHAKDIYLARPADLKRKLGAAQFTVTCTEYNREHLAALAPPGATIKRMYHGIDLNRFAPDTAKRGASNKSNSPLVVSVGRLREKKGFETLIEACRLLRDQGIEFRCQIIGYGEERAKLQQLISEHRLENVVALLGKLTQDKVIEIYRAATLFALPCQVGADGDRDGIPNVLLEAMAMELPVVSTAISGIPEVIRHGSNGMLVREKDAPALAHVMRSVMADTGLQIRLGVAARTTVAEQFSNDRNLRELRGLLARTTSKTSSLASQSTPPPNVADRVSDGEIAYVLKGFPRLSEAFIAHEIHLLEIMGKRLRLFVIKPGEEDKVHDVVRRIKAPISYLPEFDSISGSSLWRWLSDNLQKVKTAHWTLFKARPLAYAKTLASAFAMSVRYRAGHFAPLRKVFIKEFVQAGAIAAEVIASPGIRHLHGHFCHGATTVTWFVSQLTGLPFSFTAHAKDIYQTDQNPGDLLARKMQAASFVATCTAANHEFLAKAAPACGHVHTVYHGLDTEYFSPSLPVAEEGAPKILAVGRFVEKKGFHYLIEACALLRREGLNFHCMLVGERGDQSQRIAELIAARHLNDVVEVRNAVTQTELREIYARATMFVLPCLVTADGDRDGIPNVLAEAMAMGLPIISTAISGIPELVDDGIDGLLVKERDAAVLADALRQLMSNRKLRQRLGAEARAKIVSRFDARRTTLKLTSLFTDAMYEEEASDALAPLHS